MSNDKLLKDIYHKIIHLHDQDITDLNGSLLHFSDRRFIKLYSSFFKNGNIKSINKVPLYKLFKKFINITPSDNELKLQIVYFLMDYFEQAVNDSQNRGFLEPLELSRICLMYKKLIQQYCHIIPSNKKIEFFKKFLQFKIDRVIFLESIDDDLTFSYSEDFNLPITLVKTANENDFMKFFNEFIQTDHSSLFSLYGKNSLISFFILSYNVFGKQNYNKFKKIYPKIYEFLTTTRFGYMRYGFIMPMSLAGNKDKRDEALKTIHKESLINLKKILNNDIKIDLSNPNDLSKLLLVYNNKKLLKKQFLNKTSNWILKSLCNQKFTFSSFKNNYFQLCSFLCFFSLKNKKLNPLIINNFLIEVLPEYYSNFLHLYDNINHPQAIEHINFLLNNKRITNNDLSNILSVIHNNQYYGINGKKLLKLYNLYNQCLINTPQLFFNGFSGQFRIKINDQVILKEMYTKAIQEYQNKTITEQVLIEICNDLLINTHTPDWIVNDILNNGFFNDSKIFSNFFKYSNYKDIHLSKSFYDRINTILTKFTKQLNAFPPSYRKAGLCRELLSFKNIDLEVIEDIYRIYMLAPKDNFWIGAMLASHKKTPNTILFQLSTTHSRYVKYNKNFRGAAQSILDIIDQKLTNQ